MCDSFTKLNKPDFHLLWRLNRYLSGLRVIKFANNDYGHQFKSIHMITLMVCLVTKVLKRDIIFFFLHCKINTVVTINDFRPVCTG